MDNTVTIHVHVQGSRFKTGKHVIHVHITQTLLIINTCIHVHFTCTLENNKQTHKQTSTQRDPTTHIPHEHKNTHTHTNRGENTYGITQE